MTEHKIITMAKVPKREPTDRERHLSELIDSIEYLQDFLTSINRQGDLWDIFNKLMLFTGDCMRESRGRHGKR